MRKILLSVLLCISCFAALDINSASKEELVKVNGIGEVKAAAIIEYRNKKCFDSVGELVQVKGFGQKTVEGVKKELVANPCKKK